jgi:hypothetical protein
MNFFEEMIVMLKFRMKDPSLFGWFHIIYIIIVIVLSTLITLFLRKKSDKAFRIFLFICSSWMIFMEVYKQFNFTVGYNAYNGTVSWDYSWYQFPFQFCSTPMYIAFFSALLWNFRINYGLLCFLGTYGLFGGVAVYIYPVSVLTTQVLTNNQSFIHHGLMIMMGIAILVNKVKKIHKSILYALPVFVVLIIIAEILNVIVRNVMGKDVDFNMFFISPYQVSSIPIAKQLQTISLKLFPLVLFLYLVVFTFLGYLLLLIAILMNILMEWTKKKTKNRIKKKIQLEELGS